MSLHNKELSEDEKNVINEHIKSVGQQYKEEIINQQWFMYHEPQGKVQEKMFKKKGEKRVVVLGKHKIYLFKLSTFKKKLGFDQDRHLYSLIEIRNKTSELVELYFEDGSAFALTSSMSLDYIKRVKDCILKISVNFDEKLIPKLEIDQERWKQFDTKTNIEIGPCSNLIETYLAKSHYYGAPVSSAFIQWVLDQEKSQTFEADLSLLSGIENGNSEIFLPAVFTSLENNNFFDSLVLYDVPRRDVFPSLALVFRHNIKITKLVASKLGNSSKIGDLARAIASNPDNDVCILDVSYNNISYSDFFHFIDMFDKYTHSLNILNLSNCMLSAKSVVELFTSFQRNYSMSVTIEELILDKASFGLTGSMAFGQWISKIHQTTPLKKLSLEGCNVSLDQILGSFELNSLEFLNLAGNNFNEKAGLPQLLDFIKRSNKLKTLNLSRCNVTGDIASLIIQNIASNEKISEMSVDLSKNKIGNSKKPVETFKNKLKSIFNNVSFYELDLSDNNFKSEDLNHIIQNFLSNNYSIHKLTIGDREHLYKNSLPIEESISNYFNNSIFLKHFCLKGKFNNVSKFLGYVSTNSIITHLDVSSMHLFDSGIIDLALSLRTNKTLLYLNVDKNTVGLNGYLALQDSFDKNNTLLHLKYPRHDLNALETSLKSSDRKQKLHQIIFSIYFSLQRNQKQAGEKYNPSMFKRNRYDYYAEHPVIECRPLGSIPEHLKNLQVPEKKGIGEDDESTEENIDNQPKSNKMFEPVYTPPTSPRSSVQIDNVNFGNFTEDNSISFGSFGGGNEENQTSTPIEEN
eukprot:TRINITY_DN4758_c0_g1_i1.p1 TRINITY_DN4758_c0_g1~~TRINITY_DN4758_c0_g1_i1.p1  ORF type:complete len:801 (+),score=235.45 TRINITY_DN4758_c0_g1_i1:195-2597(+)